MESWRTLLRRGLVALASLERAGIPPPAWAMGGRTALMLHYAHRESRDVDLFLRDVQYLPALSPRLNDETAALGGEYVEAATFLKLAYAEGEVDFIVAPALTPAPPLPLQFEDAIVPLEAPIEIAAKRAFYRSAELKARDVFDLAWVLEREADADATLAALVRSKRDILSRRVERLARAWETSAAPEIAVLPGGRALLHEAPARVLRWLSSVS